MKAFMGKKITLPKFSALYKKRHPNGCLKSKSKTKYRYGMYRLFLGISLVLVHELINASGGVNKFQLTREERVRSVGDFKLYNRILITVGVGNGFFGGCAALGEHHGVVRHILEYNQAVIFGMDSFFHRI